MRSIRDIRGHKPSKEEALKAREIVNNAFRTDKRNTVHVSPADLHTTNTGWKVTTVTKMPGERARLHNVRIQMPKGYHGKFSKCAEVKGDCDCLTGDTLVLTSEGWKEIREIAQPLSPDTDFLPVKYDVKGKLFAGTFPYYKGRKSVYKVTLDNGLVVSATENHRLLTVDVKHKAVFDGIGRTYTRSDRHIKRKWKKVSELRGGEKLDVNDHDFGSFEQDLQFWEAYFIGVLMGDGTLFNTGYPDLQLYGEKSDLVEFLSRSEVVSKVREVNKGVRVAFNARAREVMSRLKFKNKDSINIRNIKDLVGYVSGLAATDGSIKPSHFAITISGGEYLRTLQMELLRFGFGSCKLWVESNAGTITNYGTRNQDLIYLRISGESLRRLIPYLHLRSSQMSKLLELADRRNEVTEKQKVPYTKVVSISYAGEQYVYDITVPKAERFVANGIIAHNCGRFLFVWNWALLQKDAAIRDRTNGMPPEITNPGYIPGICKHGIVAMKAMLALDPMWPASVIGDKNHPKVGAPVTLSTLRTTKLK
jgi:intein/homing endonuclease